MSLYVGLDVGTQSVKLLAYDPERREVAARASAPLEMISRDDGTREQLAGWWIEAIRRCFAAVPAPLRARVRAIGVSGQQHGFVPVDAVGRVLAPVKLWCDTSTHGECDEIMAAVGGRQRCIDVAGNPILAGYTASKLAWTRRHRPDAWAAMATVLLPHDYVDFWLTGHRYMEAGDASGTGWMDVRARRWSPQLLAAIDPDRDLAAALPPLVAHDATFAIHRAAAEELGLPADVRICAGGGDNMMAAIGTGAVVPGRLTMSLGTSGTLFAFSDVPVVDAGARWAAFCASTDGWLPLICTMNCTVATEKMSALLGIAGGGGDALVDASRPGADGLVMLPFFNGERTPDLPEGRACLHGMTMANATPANLYRAAMEGATYSLRNGFDAFVDAGMQFDTIRLTGGGSRSAAWRQMVADVFDLPVSVPQQQEGAAFGAALQALWAAGHGGRGAIAEIVRDHVQEEAAFAARPQADHVPAYADHYRRFLRHLDAVRHLYSGDAAATTDPTRDTTT